jgi:hypothetical protein
MSAPLAHEVGVPAFALAEHVSPAQHAVEVATRIHPGREAATARAAGCEWDSRRCRAAMDISMVMIASWMGLDDQTPSCTGASGTFAGVVRAWSVIVVVKRTAVPGHEMPYSC